MQTSVIYNDYLRYLKMLVPLGELTNDNLNQLATKTPIEDLTEGQTLFSKGDLNKSNYYLIMGKIALIDGDETKAIIAGGTPAARFPLDHNQTRQVSATALTDLKYIRIDNDLLDILLTWEQNSTSYTVSELDTHEENESDWMTEMLRSELFHRIPAENIQAVFMGMEAISFTKGEQVIRQGDEGDYYYHIRKGKCLVSHTTKSGKTLKLAELTPGSGFGEDALVSDSPRNANISMSTDGVLMRLCKKDFQRLLKEPVLKRVDKARADELVADGARWLDVRLETEYKNGAIENSLNLPLYLLRFKMNQLDKATTYIVYCDTGRRSSSATYLLNEEGYEAYLLQDGLMGQAIKFD